MTTDRFFAIYYPLKATVYSTPRRARLVCFALLLPLALINSIHLLSHEVQQFGGTSICWHRDRHSHMMTRVWPSVDAVIYSYLPSTLMIIFNGLIMYRMCSQRNRGPLPDSYISKHASRVTTMLLGVTTFFILTTVPVHTTFIYHRTNGSYHHVLYTCLDILMITNHSANFYLYCMNSKGFRKDLVNMMTCHKPNITDSESQPRNAVY